MQTNAILLFVAVIWGFGFVAQRLGMDHLGPFTFNGIRFILGGLCLLPLAMRSRRTQQMPAHRVVSPATAGICAGILLFIAASLQQVGLVYTSAGKAGFITGIYVVFVPLIGLLLGKNSTPGTWLGVVLAISGLYLLSIQGAFRLNVGDALELAGALFWALHVVALAYFSPRTSPVRLAMVQFYVCGLCSLVIAALFEPISLQSIGAAYQALLYSSILSVGAGYTLQVVAQQKARPSHAAILLSMEAPFAALGGWLILQETLTMRALLGCGLMLAAILITQLWPDRQESVANLV
ncbi:MAG: DMT family transporter [Desulfobulbaceae bacterium]|nr:DMT family transporter [Desulfobulbaceae bacterium]